MLLGAEVPSSKRDGQEGIDAQAELVHMQPNVAGYELGGRRPDPLEGLMFPAKSFKDWPVSQKSSLRHIVIDGTTFCVSSRALALHIANRVVVHIVIVKGSYHNFRKVRTKCYHHISIMEVTLYLVDV